MNHLKLIAAIVLILTSSTYAQESIQKELIGNYACTFTQEGYTYDPFTCVINKVDEQLVLEKISGSQRIKGNIQLTEKGFDFEGTYFCPYGDCTSPAKGQFKKLSQGIYEGPVRTEDIPSETIVKLTKRK